jgi:hypothetical protein
MAVSADASVADFSDLDNAGISKEHWKIMFISGMGVFTDAYDLFIIGVVMSEIAPALHGTAHRGSRRRDAQRDAGSTAPLRCQPVIS